MTTIFVLFRGTAKAGKEDTVAQLLLGVVGPTRNEGACIAYELHRDVKNPRRFYCYEAWESDAALERHLRTDHIQKLAKELWPLLEESFNEAVIRLSPMSSIFVPTK